MKRIAKIFIALIVLVFIINTAISIVFPIKYKNIVYNYSLKYNLDPFLVFSIIKTESNFNEKAISSKNARGLMQISEGTAQWAVDELKIENFKPDNLFDPEVNIMIGTWYISKLLKQFGNLEVALAAYNAGSGNVTNWLKDDEYSYDSSTLYKIPYQETDNFVKKVLNNFRIYNFLYDDEVFTVDSSVLDKTATKIHSFILEIREGE
ncbi:lytic transglycosylase domain-containing protein [Soehngenia saccharolytica]|nr:lytic transglycosylase domain-containing protein [Soehngenia saccharolytica]